MNLKETVQLQAVVRADGTVKDVHVVGGHPMLAAAAEQAVMKSGRRHRLSQCEFPTR